MNKMLGLTLLGVGVYAYSQMGGAEAEQIGSGGGGGFKIISLPSSIPSSIPTSTLAQAPATTKKTTTGGGSIEKQFQTYQERLANIPISSKEYINISGGGFFHPDGKKITTTITKTLGGGEIITTKKEKMTREEMGLPAPFISPAPEKTTFGKITQFVSPVTDIFKTAYSSFGQSFGGLW